MIRFIEIELMTSPILKDAREKLQINQIKFPPITTDKRQDSVSEKFPVPPILFYNSIINLSPKKHPNHER